MDTIPETAVVSERRVVYPTAQFRAPMVSSTPTANNALCATKRERDGFQAEGDDVPKASPLASPAPNTHSQPAQPLNLDEGAAYKSFAQG